MSRKPIYIFIVPFFPSKNSHVGSYIHDQIKALQDTKQYKVIVLKATTNYKKGGDYEFGGVQVYRFKEKNLPSALWAGFFNESNFSNLDKCLSRIGVNINDIAVVHAHVHNQGAYAVHLKKRNSKILTILQHHGYDVLGMGDGRFANFQWHKKHVRKYISDICNNIDLHIGVSQATLDIFAKYPEIRIKDSLVLYNGVDKKVFYPLPKKSNNKFTIGCVANFWKIKDQITLIKAVEILVSKYKQDIKAIFVGTGFTLSECKQYAIEHNLSEYIEFRNTMPHTKLNDFYNSLDLFVLPSYWDTLGCVYLEAYACGVPFITAEGTGVKELIPENEWKRWVVPKSNYRCLANMIRDYIENRYQQNLTQPIDIHKIIGNFLDTINKKMIVHS